MDEWFREIGAPAKRAVVTFITLFLVFITLTMVADLTDTETRVLLFLLGFACSALVAKQVYTAAASALDTHRFKQQLVADVTMSSHDLYTQLYQNSPVPYLLIDHAGIVASANTAAGRMFGQPAERITGLHIFDRFRADSRDRLDFMIDKFQSGLSVSDETVRVQRLDGEEGWALLSLFSFTDSFGAHMGMLTLVDITRQKQVENAKSEFVSLASHQLRTPIAGIKWSAELLLLEEDNLSKQQRKYVDRLLTGVSRMALLIDDFLRVSRFELGTFQPEYTTVDLHDLVKNVVSEQDPRVKQRQIEVKTFFDPHITSIISDQNLLRMALSNLYSNAVKYTREGGTIHLGFCSKEDRIILSVADNGMGIPIIEQEHIFSKLFRASNAVRNVPDGTGLGLYIVKEAIRVLGGRVSFTSTENVGTTFEITLPREVPVRVSATAPTES